MDLNLDKTATIDILNISHDDVLQLYRGWRRSEGLLKDKNKELSTLRKRMEQLQEAHVKFHGQIQALKSVKELTVNLQSQLSALQQENIQLSNENQALSEKSSTLERTLVESTDKSQTVVRETQIDQAILRGRCQELTIAQKNLESKLDDEQAARLSSEKRLDSSEQLTNKLREENQNLKDELLAMTQRVSQCDGELAVASNQLTTLSKEIAHITSTQQRLSTAEVEVGMLKGDISRLIHLLEHYEGAQGFIAQWKDSKNMTFVGLNKRNAPSSPETHNISFNTGNGDEEDLISPTEYAHLQRLYGCDPFPMTSSFVEEIDYWAPHELVQHGLIFVEKNTPHISKSVIMDFITTMNRIWMRREKRKITRINERFKKQIAELQRQNENSKPYRDVMAEAAVKRLQSEVKSKRCKILTGRAKKYHELSNEERNYFDVSDEYGDLDNMVGSHHHHNERRLCQLPPKGSKSHIKDLTANKLLVASLESLETLNKQHVLENHMSVNRSTRISHSSQSPRRSKNGSSPRKASASFYSQAFDSADDLDEQPSEEYLRGALWLGRNFATVIEELATSIEQLRLKCLKDVNAAMQDTDKNRSCNRLSLITNSIITEYTALIQKTSFKGREMLQGAASISIGDFVSYDKFLKSLPIESLLHDKSTNYMASTRTMKGPPLENAVSPRVKPVSPFRKR